jgi:hypothetical protein
MSAELEELAGCQHSLISWPDVSNLDYAPSICVHLRAEVYIYIYICIYFLECIYIYIYIYNILYIVGFHICTYPIDYACSGCYTPQRLVCTKHDT